MDEKDGQLLEELYRRFLSRPDEDINTVLNASEWLWVDEMLMQIAKRAIRACSATYKIPEKTWPELQETVRFSLRKKFYERRFQDWTNFMGLIRSAAYRDTLSALRTIRSVLPCALADNYDQPSEIRLNEVPELFDEIRAHFVLFRWPEYPHIRELILSVFLMTWRYPGPNTIRALVPTRCRLAVYNSAVYDINDAIGQVTISEAA